MTIVTYCGFLGAFGEVGFLFLSLFVSPGGKYKAVSQEILGLFSGCAAIHVLSGVLYTQGISHSVSFLSSTRGFEL